MEKLRDNVEMAAERPGTFRWSDHWQAPVLLVGGLVFASAVWAWKYPISTWHRNEALKVLDQAEKLEKEGRPEKAIPLLKALAPALWRIEDRASEYYYYLGASYDDIAEVAKGLEKRSYRRAGRDFLREAERLGAPSELNLFLDERIGQCLMEDDRYFAGSEYFLRALNVRRQIQSVLYRRLIEAHLREKPIVAQEIRKLTEQWATADEIPPEDRTTAENAVKLANAGRLPELRDLLADSANYYMPPDADPNVYMIDIQAKVDIGNIEVDPPIEPASEVIDWLRESQATNSERLAFLLAGLCDAAEKNVPPDKSAALDFARQRAALRWVTDNESELARLRYAELLLGDRRSAQARATILRDDPNRPLSQRERFIVGESLVEDADHTLKMSANDWKLAFPNAARWEQTLRNIGVPQQYAKMVEASRLKRMLADSLYVRAADLLNMVIDRPDMLTDDQIARGLLLLARAYRELHKFEPAENAYRRVIKEYSDTNFERAARFLMADLLRVQKSPNALAALEAAAKTISEQPMTPNSNLSLDRIRRIFEDAWDQYQKAGQYREAMQVAYLYEPFSLDGMAANLLGESARTLAEATARQAKSMLPDDAQRTLLEARTLYREAGEAYEKAADTDPGSLRYADLLWQASVCLFEGQAFTRAIRPLRLFIELHGRGERALLANLYLARSLMNQGDLEEAKQTLEDALEDDPRSPNRFDARYWLARDYMEMARAIGETGSGAQAAQKEAEMYRGAEKILLANVDGLSPDLEPAAREWRQSLFLLGELYYRMQEYDPAILRFREAIRRYPDDSEVLNARVLSADSFWRSAGQMSELIKTEPQPGRRAERSRERHERLMAAHHEYTGLVNLLVGREIERKLTTEERQVLWRSLFKLGEVQTELGDMTAAIAAYQEAALHYIDHADSIIAQINIALIYLNQGKIDDARGTVRQAIWILENRLKSEDAFFNATYSRAELEQRLKSLLNVL